MGSVGTLLAQQVEQLSQEGYLLVEDVLDEELDLEPVEREYAEILDLMASKLHAEGKISQTYSDLEFGKRFVAVAAESEEPIFQHFEISFPFKNLTATTPINLGEATFNLLRSPRILDLLEPILGGEIYSSPVQHTRLKLPSSNHAARHNGHLTEATLWHQDLGAVLPEADRTLFLTVWIAMTDANEQNGCLVYQPGSHLQGLALHCPTTREHRLAGSIPDEWIPKDTARSAPARRGSVLIHLPMMKHRSFDNSTDDIRWSFDLRYQRTGEPTGRPIFPGFVARSRSAPHTELADVQEWRRLWEVARSELVGAPPPAVHRWTTEAAACA
jgi:phytanoyl-CoA hydroxylase